MSKDILRELPLFAGLPEEDLDRLLAMGEPVTVRAGDVLIEEGTPADGLYVALEGRFDAALATGKRALAAAKAAAREAMRAYESIGTALWLASARGLTARLNLDRGEAEAAWAELSSLSVDNEERQRDFEGVLFASGPLMQAGLAVGRLADLRRFCGWFIPALEREGVWRFVGELLYWRGLLCLAEGDNSAALADLERGRELLLRAEANCVLWRLDAALAEVLERMGDHEGTSAARRRARELVARLTANISDRELRESFLARRDVVALREPGSV